jgi:hypothetical protein
MSASMKTRGGALRPRLLTGIALVALAMLVVAAVPLMALAYPDRFGGAPTGPSSLPFTEQPTLHPDRVDEINARRASLPFTEQHVLPAGAHSDGVYLATETPGTVRHAGHALLSDETVAPGKTVLVVRGGSLYQLSHQ